MATATVQFEFPEIEQHLATLPKRKASKLAALWDRVKAFQEFQRSNGDAVPQRLAAKLIGISHQRVAILSGEGRLTAVDFEGHPYVTLASVVEFAKSERKTGRPMKTVAKPTAVEMWKESVKIAKGIVRNEP